MGELAEIFERYGYDPDDPVRSREAPDRLLRTLASVDAPVDGKRLGDRTLAGLPPSARELSVLELAACGLTDEEIGAHLFISAVTVKTHLKRVYVKLCARNRAHAVGIALRRGLILTTPSSTMSPGAAHSNGRSARKNTGATPIRSQRPQEFVVAITETPRVMAGGRSS